MKNIKHNIAIIDGTQYSQSWTCKELLSIDNFSKQSRNPTWLRHICKQCGSKYRASRIDKINEYKKKNRKYILQYQKEHNKKYRESWALRLRCEKNRDKQRWWTKKRRENNIEKRKQYAHNHNQKPETKFLHRLVSSKRRSKINGTDDKTITAKTTLQLLDKQEWKCKICNCNLKECEYHLDHIIPLSKWWLHTILNVQRLCQKCNIVKQDKIYPLTFH